VYKKGKHNNAERYEKPTQNINKQTLRYDRLYRQKETKLKETK